MGRGAITGFGCGSAPGRGGPDGAALRAKVAKIVASCGARSVQVRIETLLAETVDVDVRSELAAPDARTCVEDGIWELEVPPEFTTSDRRTWKFAFPD